MLTYSQRVSTPSSSACLIWRFLGGFVLSDIAPKGICVLLGSNRGSFTYTVYEILQLLKTILMFNNFCLFRLIGSLNLKIFNSYFKEIIKIEMAY